MTTDANRAWYERSAQVREFGSVTHVELPEAWLLAQLGADLADMDMLDLGVGGGRTTHHFAPGARSYLGVDYSEPLVQICRGRFAGQDGVAFLTADARSMSTLTDESFDLVLFSVNSLDCVDHEGRLAALAEIARLTRPGGLFFFSSHNLDAIAQALSVRRFVADLAARRSARTLPLALARRLPSHLLKRLASPSSARLARAERVWISKLWPPTAPQMTYHLTPGEARRQLDAVGFDLLDVVLPSGVAVGVDGAGGRSGDLWLNYLARRRPRGTDTVTDTVATG